MLWHLFFDTTEFFTRGGFPAEAILAAAAKARATLYVPELVLEERALQLLIKRQPEVSNPPLKPDDPLLESLRADLRAKLTEKKVTISPFNFIDTATQLTLFNRRLHAEFKDTVIILSVIDYAATRALPLCGFVTDDDGIGQAGTAALSAFARTRGVLIVWMKRSDLTLILQQQPGIVAKAATFVESQVNVLETYLNREEVKARIVQHIVADPHVLSMIPPDRLATVVERLGGQSPDVGTVTVRVVTPSALVVPRTLIDGQKTTAFLR
jgi:hypothetical protein